MTATSNEILTYFSIAEVQKSKLRIHQAMRQEAIRRLRKQQFWVKWHEIGEAFGRTGSSCQNLLKTEFPQGYESYVRDNFDRIVIDKVMLVYDTKIVDYLYRKSRVGWFREINTKKP